VAGTGKRRLRLEMDHSTVFVFIANAEHGIDIGILSDCPPVHQSHFGIV